MSKRFKMIFVALAILTLAFIFVGCQPQHTHEFGDWQKDATTHYRFCSCGEKWGEAEHNVVDGICSVCGYTQSVSHTHNFTRELVEEKYLNTSATCDQKATYFYSCECGAKGTTTFETGEYGHNFTRELAEDKYFNAPASCNQKATYFYSCVLCGEKGTETFETGTTILDHNFVDNQPCNVCHASFGLEYELAKDGQSYIVASIGDCVDTNVVIPRYYNGLLVTSIGEEAFIWYTSLDRVVIPDSVTSIGDSAFGYCTSLTSVTIPNSVTSIGNYAFANCFFTSVTIPNSVTSIGDGAFVGCRSLANVSIGNSVKSIGCNVFAACRGLTNIVIPDSVASIGDGAFNGCTGLTSITIPGGVTTIGEGAFCNCTSLVNIVVDQANTVYQSIDGNLYTKDTKTLVQYATGKPQTTFVVPDSVTTIGDYAFIDCESLASIVIPDSVTSIGESAFDNCTGLTSVIIGKGVTNIGDSVFYNCIKLDKIYYLGTPEQWSNVNIEEEYTEFDVNVYYYSETMPTEEGNYWHYDTDGKTPVVWHIHNFNKQVATEDFICSSASCNQKVTYFYSCVCGEKGTETFETGEYGHNFTRELEEDKYFNAPASCNQKATYFYSCVLCGEKGTETFETGTTILDHNFVDNQPCTVCHASFGLEYWLAEDGQSYIVASIGDCVDTNVVIPRYYNGLLVTAIRDNAFFMFEPLAITSITIPDSVASIGDGAFQNCPSLTNITIGKGVTTIGDMAFVGCISLVNIVVDQANTAYQSIDGNLYTKDAKTFVQYACGKEETTFIVPNYVTTIGDYALAGCYNLTSVTIPGGVTTIGDMAFVSCISLVNIVVDQANTAYQSIDGNLYTKDTKTLIQYAIAKPQTTFVVLDGVTTISDGAFGGCYNLREVTIPYGVITIGASAFAVCSNLIKITIPDGVTTMGDEAFMGCSNLIEITIPNSVTSIGEYAFTDCTRLVNLTIGNGITSIGKYAFENCTSLTSVTIGNNVTSIDYGAFKNCESLTNVTIPDSVTSIVDWAFCDCESLTGIVIGNGVTSIGHGAFVFCSSLKTAYYKGTATEWAKISIDTYNNSLLSATIYYYSETMPTEEGNYWHYDTDGKTPVLWHIHDFNKQVATEDFICSSASCEQQALYYYSCECGEKGTETFESGAILDHNFVDNQPCTVCHASFGLEYELAKGGQSYIVASIGDCADTNVVIPRYYNGLLVTSIGEDAFFGCDDLTSVIIPDSVTSIGDGAFRYCISLTSVTIPNSVTTIDDGAFYHCFFLTNITIPDSVTSIGGWAFNNCMSLTNITIPDGVTFIGEETFSGCQNLENVTIPDSVTGIFPRAFYNCCSLTSITIPSKVEFIEWEAFFGCSRLVEVISKSPYITVTKRSEDNGFIGYRAWSVFNSGDTVNSKLYYDNDFVVFVDGAEKTLLVYHGSETDVVIPSYVTEINMGVFKEGILGESNSIKSITIPDSVMIIWSYAFMNCQNLTSVTIGKGVTNIYSDVFERCDSLTSIFYNGTATEWAKISIDKDNDPLSNATIYYYSATEPTDDGNYWHYDTDGKTPVVWTKQD